MKSSTLSRSGRRSKIGSEVMDPGDPWLRPSTDPGLSSGWKSGDCSLGLHNRDCLLAKIGLRELRRVLRRFMTRCGKSFQSRKTGNCAGEVHDEGGRFRHLAEKDRAGCRADLCFMGRLCYRHPEDGRRTAMERAERDVAADGTHDGGSVSGSVFGAAPGWRPCVLPVR